MHSTGRRSRLRFPGLPVPRRRNRSSPLAEAHQLPGHPAPEFIGGEAGPRTRGIKRLQTQRLSRRPRRCHRCPALALPPAMTAHGIDVRGCSTGSAPPSRAEKRLRRFPRWPLRILLRLELHRLPSASSNGCRRVRHRRHCRLAHITAPAPGANRVLHCFHRERRLLRPSSIPGSESIGMLHVWRDRNEAGVFHIG